MQGFLQVWRDRKPGCVCKWGVWVLSGQDLLLGILYMGFSYSSLFEGRLARLNEEIHLLLSATVYQMKNDDRNIFGDFLYKFTFSTRDKMSVFSI